MSADRRLTRRAAHALAAAALGICCTVHAPQLAAQDPPSAAAPQPPAGAQSVPAPRTFLFTSTTTVPRDAAAAGAVDVWIPLPVSNGYQDVTLLGWGLDDPQATWIPDGFAIESATDAASGNAMLHVRVPQGGHPEFSVTARTRVVRRAASDDGRPDGSGEQSLAAGLAPNRLIPLDGRIAELAQGLPAASDAQALGRELFEAVRERMTYDKVAPGWGAGDAVRACEVGKGNCTDFHALFIALARARGIPARFTIGYSLPETPTDGSPLSGYHCWAEFHTEEHGWIPVDISEADKAPQRAEEYFGQLTTNRIALTSGRDLQLAPPQRGAPLNYFLKPYAERSGEPLEGLAHTVSALDT
jgi:transglutaminase-like putative cysteine protease